MGNLGPGCSLTHKNLPKYYFIHRDPQASHHHVAQSDLGHFEVKTSLKAFFITFLGLFLRGFVVCVVLPGCLHPQESDDPKYYTTVRWSMLTIIVTDQGN